MALSIGVKYNEKEKLGLFREVSHIDLAHEKCHMDVRGGGLSAVMFLCGKLWKNQ